MGYTYEQLIQQLAVNNVKIIDAVGTGLLEITRSTNDVTVEGMGATGGDLILKCNTTDAQAKITLYGLGKVVLNTANGQTLDLNVGGVTAWRLGYASNETKIYGAESTGDTTYFYANQIDSYPYLKLIGDSYAALYVKDSFYILNSSDTMLNKFDGAGALFMLETSTPTAVTNYGAIYTKNDNLLYFQDGAGTEHTVAFV